MDPIRRKKEMLQFNTGEIRHIVDMRGRLCLPFLLQIQNKVTDFMISCICNEESVCFTTEQHG